MVIDIILNTDMAHEGPPMTEWNIYECEGGARDDS